MKIFQRSHLTPPGPLRLYREGLWSDGDLPEMPNPGTVNLSRTPHRKPRDRRCAHTPDILETAQPIAAQVGSIVEPIEASRPNYVAPENHVPLELHHLETAGDFLAQVKIGETAAWADLDPAVAPLVLEALAVIFNYIQEPSDQPKALDYRTSEFFSYTFKTGLTLGGKTLTSLVKVEEAMSDIRAVYQLSWPVLKTRPQPHRMLLRPIPRSDVDSQKLIDEGDDGTQASFWH